MTTQNAKLTQVTAFDAQIIARGIGANKDSYHLSTWFTLDLATGGVTVKCKATRNFYHNNAEVIAEGEPTVCLQAIQERVDQYALASQTQEVSYADQEA